MPLGKGIKRSLSSWDLMAMKDDFEYVMETRPAAVSVTSTERTSSMSSCSPPSCDGDALWESWGRQMCLPGMGGTGVGGEKMKMKNPSLSEVKSSMVTTKSTTGIYSSEISEDSALITPEMEGRTLVSTSTIERRIKSIKKPKKGGIMGRSVVSADSSPVVTGRELNLRILQYSGKSEDRGDVNNQTVNKNNIADLSKKLSKLGNKAHHADNYR